MREHPCVIREVCKRLLQCSTSTVLLYVLRVEHVFRKSTSTPIKLHYIFRTCTVETEKKNNDDYIDYNINNTRGYNVNMLGLIIISLYMWSLMCFQTGKQQNVDLHMPGSIWKTERVRVL